MAAAPMDAHERAPEWVIRREYFTGDECKPSCGVLRIAPTGNLWREGEEQFVEGPLGEKVSHQMRSPFNQDHICRARLRNCREHSLRRNRAGVRCRGQ